MIGLDTNVIVRYIAQDDVRQAAAASRLLERELTADNPGFVGLVTLCELAWVLADCYHADKARIEAVVKGLLGSKQLFVEDGDIVWKALRAWEKSAADFSDVLLGQVLAARGCDKIVTLDKVAAKLAGFALLG